MANKHVLKESFAIQSKIESFFTGNKIEISADGQHLLGVCGDALNIIDINSGRVVNQLKSDSDDMIITFALSPDSNIVIVAHESALVRQWLWREQRLERTWKSIHSAAICVIQFDNSNTLVATASTDSTIKVWDIVRNYCTHNLKGAKGVFSVVRFSTYDSSKTNFHIFGAADDYSIHVWDLISSKHETKLESHCSKVTAIELTSDEQLILTSSRDKLVIVWDAIALQKIRTIPVFEAVESLQIIPSECVAVFNFNLDVENVFITGGERGVLRIWNYESGSLLHTQENSLLAVKNESEDNKETISYNQLITQCIYCQQISQIAVVSFENNIIFHDIQNLSPVKQLIGNNDEVLDIKLLGEKETHMAVATNSPNIKIFEISTLNCYLLKGHTDIVLSLDTFLADPSILLSSSKDNTIKVWKFEPSFASAMCLFYGSGHSHSVTAIAAANTRATFFVSGSEDTTIKVWKLPSKLPLVCLKPDTGIALMAKYTQHAHEKTINSIAISPNDQIIASGSQDKTAKIWSIDGLKMLGVIRGHRRGVWCVQFSPVDQVVVTASADSTIKIWALNDYSCLKTFQGHDCAILKVLFIDGGMQLISSGTDGNVKIWNIKQNECVKTIDAHNDKIWALITSINEEILITGGADSRILIWNDVTVKEKEEIAVKLDNQVKADQTLMNLMQKKKWLKALKLAIRLDYPFRALSIIKEILIDENGFNELETNLSELRDDQLLTLFNYALIWNTNSKHYIAAQYVIKAIYEKIPSHELLKLTDFKENIEKLLPYTERHLNRLTRLQQYVTFIDFVWEKIKLPEIKVNDLSAKMISVNIDNKNDTECQRVSGDSRESDNDSDD